MSQKTKKILRSGGDSPPMNPSLTDSIDNQGIIQYGIGFDVHRDKIAVCVAAQLVNGEILEIKSHTFRASPDGIGEIIRFSAKYTPISNFLMECTGVYHLPLYHALCTAFPDQKDKVIAMNPLLLNHRISDLGNKTDPISARSLAFITFYKSILKPSYIGSMQFFRLRDMIRSYHKTHRQSTACKNRIHRMLHSLNAKIELDLNAEWCILFLESLTMSKGTILKIFDDMIAERKRNKLPTGVLSKQLYCMVEYSEISLSDEDRFVLRMELGRLLQEQLIAASFLKRAEQYVIQDPVLLNAYKRLSLIPGLGSLGVLTVLLEVGDYMRFGDWKAFVRYCGVIPAVDKSGKTIIKGHINRYSNKNLRYVLTQSAGVIINRCDRTTDLGEFAHRQRILRRLPYKKAVLKVANKLAKVIYNVLVLGLEYDLCHEHAERLRKKQENRLKKTNTLLEPFRTRALRRDINNFLGANFEYLNSSSRFQVLSGFERMIRKAKYLDSDNP